MRLSLRAALLGSLMYAALLMVALGWRADSAALLLDSSEYSNVAGFREPAWSLDGWSPVNTIDLSKPHHLRRDLGFPCAYSTDISSKFRDWPITKETRHSGWAVVVDALLPLALVGIVLMARGLLTKEPG